MPPILRRLTADPQGLEAGVRTLLANLRESADLNTAEVLASATNVYFDAISRFRSTRHFTAQDLLSLFEIWERLLNVHKLAIDFAPSRPKPEPEVAEADAED
jgi:hypothetical protein